jgi:hypothetical protein
LLKELQLLNVNSDYEEGEIQAFWWSFESKLWIACWR